MWWMDICVLGQRANAQCTHHSSRKLQISTFRSSSCCWRIQPKWSIFSSQVLDVCDGWRKRKGVSSAGVASLEFIGCADTASYKLLSVHLKTCGTMGLWHPGANMTPRLMENRGTDMYTDASALFECPLLWSYLILKCFHGASTSLGDFSSKWIKLLLGGKKQGGGKPERGQACTCT